jgi:hypothetical protein
MALTGGELDFDAWRKAQDAADQGWDEAPEPSPEAQADVPSGSHHATVKTHVV